MEQIFNCTAYGKLGRFSRFSFRVSNLLSLMANLAAVACGLWVLISKRPFSALFEPTLFVDVAFLLLFIGLMAALTNAIGFYVTHRELRCFMYSFSVACLVLFLMLFLAGLMAFIFQKQLKVNALDLQMLTALRTLYGQWNEQGITDAWDMMQEQFQCCGIDDMHGSGFDIWRTSKWHMNHLTDRRPHVPASCCTRSDGAQYVNVTECQFGEANNDYVYAQGCYKRFEKHLIDVSSLEGIVGLLASVSMIQPALFCALLSRLTQK